MSVNNARRMPCPKCNRSLEATGTINLGQNVLFAYQCGLPRVTSKAR